MENKRNTTVINLFGGPGVGKSTMMAGLFNRLKILGYEVEMAPEYAKEKVWEQAEYTMEDQIYIFAKQLHRIWRLDGKVDYIICDSPLLNSIIYDKSENEALRGLVFECFNSYNNANYFIERGAGYVKNGRQQTEDEAKLIDSKILKLFKVCGIKYHSLTFNSDNSDDLIKRIIEEVTLPKNYCKINVVLPLATSEVHGMNGRIYSPETWNKSLINYFKNGDAVIDYDGHGGFNIVPKCMPHTGEITHISNVPDRPYFSSSKKEFCDIRKGDRIWIYDPEVSKIYSFILDDVVVTTLKLKLFFNENEIDIPNDAATLSQQFIVLNIEDNFRVVAANFDAFQEYLRDNDLWDMFFGDKIENKKP